MIGAECGILGTVMANYYCGLIGSYSVSNNGNIINGNGYFFQYNQSSKILRQVQVFSGCPISTNNISYMNTC